MGEIRILVNSQFRNNGLGTIIARELVGFARELKLEKVISYIPADSKGAQRMLEEVGFRAEALLTDWIKTRDNKTHDMAIMSRSLKEIG